MVVLRLSKGTEVSMRPSALSENETCGYTKHDMQVKENQSDSGQAPDRVHRQSAGTHMPSEFVVCRIVVQS